MLTLGAACWTDMPQVDAVRRTCRSDKAVAGSAVCCQGTRAALIVSAAHPAPRRESWQGQRELP